MVSAERFISTAWELELTICSLITERTPAGYLDMCRDQAKRRDVDVFNLNFNDYESPLAAFVAEDNRELIATLEQCRRKTLVIFEGADVLAPLECNETFWLRSLLVNSDANELVVLFVLTTEEEARLFQDCKGAFYRDSVDLN
jgi:hypothetical protein